MITCAVFALLSLMPTSGGYEQCAIRTDGSLIAAVGREGIVTLHDSELKLVANLQPALDAECQELAFSPDGTRLAAQVHDGRTLLWRIDGEAATQVAPAKVIVQYSFDWHRPKSYGAGLTWSPDSSRFVTINSQGHRRLYDADGLLIRRLDAEGFEHGAYDALWHAPSRALLLREQDGVGVYDWETGERRMRGGEHFRFPTASPPSAFALSPSGDQLVVGSKSLRLELFLFETGERLRSMRFPHNGLDNPNFLKPLQLRYSPNGEWLAMTSEGGADTGVLEAETLIVKYNRDSWGAHWSETFAINWSSTSDRLLFHFTCGCGGSSELVLGEKFTWNDYDKLSSPRTGTRTGIGIMDGELTRWKLHETSRNAKVTTSEEGK